MWWSIQKVMVVALFGALDHYSQVLEELEFKVTMVMPTPESAFVTFCNSIS